MGQLASLKNERSQGVNTRGCRTNGPRYLIAPLGVLALHLAVMAMIESESGELVFFTDHGELSPQRRAALERMHAEMEDDRAGEEDARAAS